MQEHWVAQNFFPVFTVMVNVSGIFITLTYFNTTIGSSSATVFLPPDVLQRPNLSVAVGVMVEKIEFDTTNNKPRAKGVILSIKRGGPRFRVSANLEVVLSAGAIATPQLLLVSGVGPKEDLKEKGIDVIHDSPWVGKNLLDISPLLDAVFAI